MDNFADNDPDATQDDIIGINTQELFFQCAQDPLAGFSQEFPVIESSATKNKSRPRPKRSSRKPSPGDERRRKLQRSSFVLNRTAQCNGRRLIQIKVMDISDNSDKVILSAQYVVRDIIDNILDQTERIIRNISENLSQP